MMVAIPVFAQRVQVPFKLETLTPAQKRARELGMQMQEAVLKAQDIARVEDLLKQGVDINAPIGCGTFSALDGAVSTGNVEMLKFLLAHGARPQGRELADAAFASNKQSALEMAKILLSAGVDPNATNHYSAPLIWAAYRGNRDLTVLLLSQPTIKVDVTDVDGSTALMRAAAHGSSDIVDLLLNAHANPDIQNKRGETATTFTAGDTAAKRAIIARLQSPRK